jgi:hypothetical protein
MSAPVDDLALIVDICTDALIGIQIVNEHGYMATVVSIERLLLDPDRVVWALPMIGGPEFEIWVGHDTDAMPPCWRILIPA